VTTDISESAKKPLHRMRKRTRASSKVMGYRAGPARGSGSEGAGECGNYATGPVPARWRVARSSACHGGVTFAPAGGRHRQTQEIPMFSLQTIFGKGDKFYGLLEASAAAARESARALGELL